MSRHRADGRPARLPGDPPGGRRAPAVLAVVLVAYAVAVAQRTSLGVAGAAAGHRLHTGAAGLSALAAVQLLVCAGAQLPAGRLAGRFGATRVLAAGLALLAAGQLLFGLADALGPALAGRALAGGGDAMAFVGVLRVAAPWFPVRRGPLVAQGVALAGVAGALASTTVLPRLLRADGWTPVLAGTAAAGAAALALVLLVVRDRPGVRSRERPRDRSGRPAAARRTRSRELLRRTAACWREPGTRLGVWTHFCAQSSATAFLLLWGFPFLVRAEGCPPGQAGMLLGGIVLSHLVLGMVYAQVTARHRDARLPLALGTVAATAVCWAAVLAWPGGRAPLWALAVLCAVLGAGGPASVIGFDFARPANPPERFAAASGLVALGGFAATLLALVGTGVLLDATGGNFRAALTCVFVLQAVGARQMLRLRVPAARRERERVPVSRVEAVHTARVGA